MSERKVKTIYFYHPIHRYLIRTGKAQEGFGLPKNSTDIPPPLSKNGEVPVFQKGNNSWILVPDNFDRTNCKYYEFIYLGSREFFQKKPITIFAPFIGEFLDPNFSHISSFFMRLKNFDNFVNPSLMSFSFKNRLNHLNERIKQLYQKRQIATLKATLTNSQNVEESIDFKVEKEEIIHEIKRIIDLLIMTTAVVHSGIPYFSAKDRIEIDCIGKLLSQHYSPSPIIKNALLVEKYEALLKLINNLHNGLKHDFLSEEYVTNHRPKEILINVAKFKDHKTNLKQIDVFSIPLRALLYACNDYISDVLLQKKTSEIYIRWAVLPAGSQRL